jgi:hypothetical protein
MRALGKRSSENRLWPFIKNLSGLLAGAESAGPFCVGLFHDAPLKMLSNPDRSRIGLTTC